MANMMLQRHLLPPDQGPNSQLAKKIIKELKINGVFDEMRKECLADIDTKVEEIEVVEEFTSGGSAEGEQIKSESNQEEEKQLVTNSRDKKKKKTKKRKAKKPKKRARTSSICSGEITSSGELSSDSSSDLNLPTSSPGRISRPYSPRRPCSPDFHRYKGSMGYGPPPGPHFRDGPIFPGEYHHPRHARLSPPPYRRSPPHRFSTGPRMDDPYMPFGSPMSPPRRPYSPPHMMRGYPRERPPFPHPHHRWRSPPRSGPRRPSRSPLLIFCIRALPSNANISYCGLHPWIRYRILIESGSNQRCPDPYPVPALFKTSCYMAVSGIAVGFR